MKKLTAAEIKVIEEKEWNLRFTNVLGECVNLYNVPFDYITLVEEGRREVDFNELGERLDSDTYAFVMGCCLHQDIDDNGKLI